MNESMRELERAETLLDSGRLMSAKACYEHLVERAAEPSSKAFAMYNLAALSWSEIGDGEEARRLYASLIAVVEESDKLRVLEKKVPLRANAFENMMLLSLSYDEYERWAARLQELRPEEDILRGQLPMILDLRNKGLPWSHALQVIAEGYYNRNDPAKDPGRYGSAASAYQLLMKHRRSLRLPRADWRRIVYEYGALVLRICSDRMKNASPKVNPREYMFIATGALPLIEECVKEHPADDTLQRLWKNVTGFLEDVEEGLSEHCMASGQEGQALGDGQSLDMGIPGMAQPGIAGMLFSLGMLASPFAGIALGYVWAGRPGAVYGLLTGMCVPCLGSSWLFFVRKNREKCCETCGRPVRVATCSPPYMRNMGVMMSVAGLRSGREGPGDKCVKCGRIFCTDCAQDNAKCRCGSKEFQTVRLLYS